MLIAVRDPGRPVQDRPTVGLRPDDRLSSGVDPPAADTNAVERGHPVCSLITIGNVNDRDPYAYVKDVLDRMTNGYPPSAWTTFFPGGSPEPDQGARDGHLPCNSRRWPRESGEGR